MFIVFKYLLKFQRGKKIADKMEASSPIRTTVLFILKGINKVGLSSNTLAVLYISSSREYVNKPVRKIPIKFSNLLIFFNIFLIIKEQIYSM